MRSNRALLATWGFVLLATATSSISQAHESNPSRYNYREHVRPIFVTHCASCHRPGGVAPMSLLEFQEAVPWANAIKMQLLEQTMPPWLPAEEVGQFRHARSLTAEEVDIVVDWAVGETPEGDPLTAEELAGPSAGLDSLPPVEVTLEPEAAVVLTEEEFEKAVCVVYPVGLETSRVANSFVVQSELRTVLRRATIYRGVSCDEGAPLATWLPDQPSVAFPSGSGVALTPSDSLAVELSYVKGWEDDGKRLEDTARLGLTFDDEAQPTELVHIEASSYQLRSARELVALYAEPPAETETEQGEEEPIRIDAVLPSGERWALLVIERYDPAWREKYVLATPLELPAGAELQTSRPGVWIDFATNAASGADDR